MLKKRVLSALIAIGVAAPFIIFAGKFAIYLFTLIIHAGCLYEYFGMVMGKDHPKNLRLSGVFTGIAVLFIYIFFGKVAFISSLTLTIFGYAVYYLLRIQHNVSELKPTEGAVVGKVLMDLSLTVFGIFFFSLFLSYIPLLRDSYEGLQWVILLMAVIWLGDTGAFFVGSKYGKRKLYPKISPNKSLEGALGGIIFSIVAATLCKWVFFWSMDYIDCIVLGTIGGVFGQVGDLVESMIKRAASVKDSGTAMPGHGGIFDRFDGIIFAAPFFYFYVSTFF